MHKLQKLLLIALTLALLALPTLAHADSNAIITNYLSEITLRTDGTLAITDSITYTASDTINGFTRDIDVLNTGGLPQLSVYETASHTSTSYQYAETAQKGDLDVFTSQILDNGNIRFFIYKPMRAGEQTTIVYRYTLAAACKRYPDIAQLDFILIGDAWELDIENYNCTISLAQPVPGDISLEIPEPGMRGLNATTARSDATQPIVRISGTDGGDGNKLSISLLFPAEALANMDYTDPAPHKHELESAMHARIAARAGTPRRTTILLAAMLALSLAIAIVARKRFAIDPPAQHAQFQFGDPLPDNTPPAELSALMSKRCRAGDSELSATLMDMVRTGSLSLTPASAAAKLSAKAAALQMNFTTTSHKPTSSCDRLALNLMCGTADSNSFCLDDIKHANARADAAANHFQIQYTAWKNAVNTATKAHGWIAESHKLPSILALLVIAVLGIIAPIQGMLTTYVQGTNAFPVIGVVVTLALLAYVAGMNKRTPAGAAQHASWEAVRREFTRTEPISAAEQSRLTSALIDAYMVYAIPLNAQDKLSAKLSGISVDTLRTLTETAEHSLARAFSYGERDDNMFFYTYCGFNMQMSNCASTAAHSSSSGGGGSGAGGGGGGGTF